MAVIQIPEEPAEVWTAMGLFTRTWRPSLGWRVELQSNCLRLRYSQECKSQHRCYSGCCECLAWIPMHFLFLWFFSYRGQTHHQRSTTSSWDSASLEGWGCSPLIPSLGLLGQKSESPVRQPGFRGHKQYSELLWSMLKWFSSRPLPDTHPDHFYSLPYLLLSPPAKFTWGARCESLFQGPL